MTEVRGQKGFEKPSEQELEDYIKKSRKSLARMKKGNSPLFFRPKRNLNRIIITIILIIAIPSIFLSLTFALSTLISDLPDFPSSSNPSNVTKTTEEISSTAQPKPEETDLEQYIENLETVINRMISKDHSTINPVIINGTVNSSRLISDTELFDLIWYLSQFENSSKWWDLGRELLFNKFPLWNESYIANQKFNVQLKALRSFLAYQPDNILLDTNNLKNFHDSCIYLWDNVTSRFDNTTNTLISFSNDSLRLASDQILFTEILAKAASFPNLFNLTGIIEYSENILNTFNKLTSYNRGIPETFYANFSLLSPIYRCEQQGEFIIILDQFYNLINDWFLVNDLQYRLERFIGNNLVNYDWSYSSFYNASSQKSSDEIIASDQSLLIRYHVISRHYSYSRFTSETLIMTLNAYPRLGFYSSSSNKSSQYILDQVQILLAFDELIEFDGKAAKYSSAYWSISILILTLFILVPLKRKLWKKKHLPPKKV